MDLNEIGVTPRKEAQFKKRGIESVEDLLRCYPKEYRDYRVPVSVRTLKDRQDERAAVLGIVTGCRILQGKHAMVRLKDKDGGNISAVWFNQAFRVRQVVLGGSYIVGGTARWDEQYQSVSFLMPDLFESFEGFRFGIKPVYRKIPGMSEEYFSSVMEEALSHIDDMGDYLSDEECKELDIPSTADTFRLAHLPESMEDVERAQRRVLVDNMYPFCREMEMKRMQAAAESPFVPLAAFEAMEQIRAFLLYQLTEDQKNALRRMLANPGKRENANAVAKTAAEKAGPHNQIAQTPGASIGDSDLSAGQWELDKIRQQTADTRAKKAVEKEMQSAMQAEATEVLHDAVKVDRAADVSAENIAQYDKMAGKITAVSRNIERRFRTIIRDEENDEAVSGLPMGSRLEARLLYHRDGKCFSRKNFPRDTPRLAVGYLADESGSMSGIAINASISTGIILEDLCRRMELPSLSLTSMKRDASAGCRSGSMWQRKAASGICGFLRRAMRTAVPPGTSPPMARPA